MPIHAPSIPTALSPARLLALLLGVVLALEVGVRVTYTPPSALLTRLNAYDAATHDARPQIWILGTCLPEQIVQPEILSSALGGQYQVWSLAAAATTPREWLLLLRHRAPRDPPLAAVVLPFGQRDLTNEMSPWESQVMALATWSDLPDLVRWACPDTACALEMTLRKASAAYRDRGYLANAFWQTLDTRPPIPGSMLSPGAVDPTDRVGTPLPGGPDMRPTGPSAAAPTDVGYLRELLRTARDLGVPLWFHALPTRASLLQSSAKGDPAYRRLLETTLQEGGAQLLDSGAIPGLTAEHFLDDVHLTPEGSSILTRYLGETLSKRLSPEPP